MFFSSSRWITGQMQRWDCFCTAGNYRSRKLSLSDICSKPRNERESSADYGTSCLTVIRRQIQDRTHWENIFITGLSVRSNFVSEVVVCFHQDCTVYSWFCSLDGFERRSVAYIFTYNSVISIVCCQYVKQPTWGFVMYWCEQSAVTLSFYANLCFMDAVTHLRCLYWDQLLKRCRVYVPHFLCSCWDKWPSCLCSYSSGSHWGQTALLNKFKALHLHS